jgi:DNA ligase-1
LTVFKNLQLIYREDPPLDRLPYPVLISAKEDGIRCGIKDAAPVSRTMKPAPNLFIRKALSHELLDGFDSEIIVGDPTAPDVFKRSDQLWKTVHLEQPFMLHVFDDFTHPNDKYWDRYRRARERINRLEQNRKDVSVRLLEHFWVNSPEELLAEEERILSKGFEGVIIRCPNAPYKWWSRTTLAEMNAFKLKRFMDSEAVILGFEEAMENRNEAYIAENGLQKRSSHQENKVGKGMLGKFLVRDVQPNDSKHRYHNVEFKIGSGWDHDFARAVWDDFVNNKGKKYLGKTLTYKYFEPGSDAAPRHAIFKNIRHETDLSP